MSRNKEESDRHKPFQAFKHAKSDVLMQDQHK